MLRECPELGHVVEDWREMLAPAGRAAYVLGTASTKTRSRDGVAPSCHPTLARGGRSRADAALPRLATIRLRARRSRT